MNYIAKHIDIASVWPEWTVVAQIGTGSYGVVYKAIRKEHGLESSAAIKVISIPQTPSEVDSLHAEGLSLDDSKTYFESVVNNFINEIRVMESLKGMQNIVSVEDYKVVEHADSIGWDIFIRMELLTPFPQYLQNHQLSQTEVVKLGCELCQALAICRKKDIIHRDIKPENIFINDFGFFKLGDFGVARKLENLTGSLSQKGTYNYMAPEVASGTHYDARVDIYSLGLVLYRLLNGNCPPFLTSDDQLKDPAARKNALERRLHGEVLPPPRNASPTLARVILKACLPDPQRRYHTPEEFQAALTAASQEKEADPECTVSVHRSQEAGTTVSVRHLQNETDDASAPTQVPRYDTSPKQKKKHPVRIAALSAVAILAVGFVVGVFVGNHASTPRIPKEAQEFNGHAYLVCSPNQVTTWEEADAYCRELGGHLATSTSQEENAFLTNLIAASGHKSAYMGLSDKESDGTWTWTTGETISYQNWREGEPNKDNSDEHYGMIYQDGTWNDANFIYEEGRPSAESVQCYVKAENNSLPLREEPNLDSSLTAEITDETTLLKFYGKAQQGPDDDGQVCDWYKVYASLSRSGWVQSALLRPVEQASIQGNDGVAFLCEWDKTQTGGML